MTARAPMYLYATEMVSSYYDRLGLRGKRVLSIVGSGDQIVNAYFFGAKEVVGFDINRYAWFMLDLKWTALRRLDYGEFLKFFGRRLAGGSLNFALYRKIRLELSLRTRHHFDKLYREFRNDGRRLAASENFRQRAMLECSAAAVNHYLKNEAAYRRCREILRDKKPIFLELDVNDIASAKRLKGNFDVINLSNVLNYISRNIKEDDLVKVLADVTKKVSRRLKPGGLFFYYSYSPSIYPPTGRTIPPASRPRIIRGIAKLNSFKASTKTFAGVNRGVFDRVNIFRV